ncbi:PspA/IM30 family protein [Paenibacillus medicaginis]|uniref:PspA/IM30 family protein n=1 Tax=Paenibacillus medicaginis TaxID=1470560 RepID=A0ABV5C389_9BACL
MGVLSRFKDVLRMNMNTLLDQADKPDKIIDDYMRKLNMDLGEVKAETAALLVAESRAQRALDECTAEIWKLEKYAHKAAEAGNEEEARRFLERKLKLTEKQQELQTAYELASTNAAGMKQVQDKLTHDFGVLEARRAELKGKMALTKAQQTQNSMDSPLGMHDSTFAAMEEQVNREYDEAMALAELRSEAKDDLDSLFEQFEKKASPTKDKE